MNIPDWLEGLAIRRVIVGSTVNYSRVGLTKLHPAIRHVTIRYTPVVNLRWLPTFLGGNPPIVYWRFQIQVHMTDGAVHQFYDIGTGNLQQALEQSTIQGMRDALEKLKEQLLAA